MLLIDLRMDAAGELAVLAREPGLPIDELEMRVELRAVQSPALGIERRRKTLAGLCR